MISLYSTAVEYIVWTKMAQPAGRMPMLLAVKCMLGWNSVGTLCFSCDLFVCT